MRLIYHPAAEAELVEAAEFYNHRLTGLGVQFLKAADHAVSIIQEDPQRWGCVESDIRRYLMSRFPYAIYYRSQWAGPGVLAGS